MGKDLVFALRSLRKKPGFTLAVILALCLGIGATTAIFSVVNGVLLRPLPFPRSERLVNIWETNFKRNIQNLPVSAADYYDWRKQNQVLSAIGTWQQATFNLAAGDNEPERYLGAICDRGFFDALGIAPLIGRVFTADEEGPGRDGFVVLSYGVWKQRFGGAPDIIGRTLVSNGRTRSVIGVMPPGFEYPAKAVMWAPLPLDAAAKARRDLHSFRVIGRLKDGVPLERARSNFATIEAQLAAQYPDLNQDWGATVIPLLEDTVSKMVPALRMLMVAVAFVLLIACANAANLLLVKAAARRREMALRNSLGASCAAIFRLVLTESLVLACVGGITGIAFAAVAVRGLVALAPSTAARVNEVALDWRALAVTVAVSLGTGILFGLAPAWYASRTDVHSLLKEGRIGVRNRLRSGLVIGQVACALVLLAGAGLLMRSFYEVSHIDAGFNPERVMTMRFAPAPFKYNNHDDLQIQLARNVLDKVAALPGVQTAAIASDMPLLGNPIYIMRFEGRPPVTPSQAPVVNYFAVTPGYLGSMGMRLIRGRWISEQDVAGTPPVVVVNQTLVDRYFPNEDPIGKRLEVAFADPPNWRRIIGVVADVRTAGLDQDSPVQAYCAYFQQPVFIGQPFLAVLARTATDPGRIAAPMKAAILSVDHSQPVYSVQAMTEVVSQSIAQRRFALVLLAFFAAAALFLAGLGLYAVMSFAVEQRTSEIGIRMALGARQVQMLFLVTRQGMSLVLAGLAIGIAGTIPAVSLMRSLLFHVSERDPVTIIGGSLALVLVALAACYFPARRASRVDPLTALRHE